MTNGLGLFFAFYILVGQPAILGRMLNNCSLYELSGLNAGIFFIAWIISAMCKCGGNKKSKADFPSQSEGETAESNPSSGVSVVKLQETTVKEIEVAKVDIKEENHPHLKDEIEKAILQNIKHDIADGDKGQKNEVKEEAEEKKEEKPMREGVSIPKIVQPLSGHQAPKKRRRERKWGQWLVLLFTLGIATVVARALWEFFGNRGIPMALFLGWILFLVIGKLFDINGFYNAKKLFTNWLYIVLIVAGIGYGIYSMQNSSTINLVKDKVVSYVQNRFKSEEVDNSNIEDTGDVIYVFEGTGEVITDIEDDSNIETDLETLDETGIIENDIEDTQLDTGIVENIQPEIEIQPEPIIEDQTPTMSDEEAKKQVTMGEAIKSLLAGATLSTKTNITFKYVSKSNELYPYFKTAQEKWMIGTDTDPSKIVSCDTYITMKGIREGRNVGSYTKDNVKAVYWNKAAELGKLNGCEKGKYVTRGNL